jgi:hypothetical protein
MEGGEGGGWPSVHTRCRMGGRASAVGGSGFETSLRKDLGLPSPEAATGGDPLEVVMKQSSPTTVGVPLEVVGRPKSVTAVVTRPGGGDW